MVKTKKLLNCENKKNEIEKKITFYLDYYSFYSFDANRRGGVVVGAFGAHARNLGSIQGRNRPSSLKQVETTPLPNARQ